MENELHNELHHLILLHLFENRNRPEKIDLLLLFGEVDRKDLLHEVEYLQKFRNYIELDPVDGLDKTNPATGESTPPEIKQLMARILPKGIDYVIAVLLTDPEQIKARRLRIIIAVAVAALVGLILVFQFWLAEKFG